LKINFFKKKKKTMNLIYLKGPLIGNALRAGNLYQRILKTSNKKQKKKKKQTKKKIRCCWMCNCSISSISGTIFISGKVKERIFLSTMALVIYVGFCN